MTQETSTVLGPVPPGWSVERLGDLATKIGSGATPRGGASIYRDDGVAFIRSQNVLDHAFSKIGLAYIDDSAADALRGVTVCRGDVLLNITGDSILRCTVVPGDVLPARVSQHVAIIRTKGRLEPLVLQKFLTSPGMKHWMLGLSSGGTRKAITKGHIESFLVPVPPPSEQRAIADVLGALDDKIESNRRLIATTWDLVGSEWRALKSSGGLRSRLGDLVDINPEKVNPGGHFDVIEYIDISSVSPRNASWISITWADAPSRARRRVRDGDVIFSSVRPNRRSFALLLDPPENCVVSTGFAVLRAKGAIGPSALAAIVDDLEFAEYLTSVAEGSAYPAVSPQAFTDYQVTLPRPSDVAAFEDRTMPSRRRAAQAEKESRVLAELRDTLLPELLSGRLRVPVAEELVEETS